MTPGAGPMIGRILPAYEWLRSYRRDYLGGDLAAGLIVGVMLVPQGMAYAMLAGLPPVVGLYAAVLPVLAYALFGSSRQLAVGPVAIVSLLVAAKCSGLAERGSAEYLGIVLLLTLIVGAVQFALGMLRLGSFVNFLSHAVISGFTSAAAVIICLSQLKHLLGVDLGEQHSALALIPEAARKIGEASPATVALGVVSIGVLLALKKKSPRFPAAILVVVGATLLTWGLGLHEHGVAIVGEVPSGFPALSVPKVESASVLKLLPTALAIVFVGFIESISIAQWVAARERYKIDANRELRALGLANIVGSFFSAYPVTGGFSRTAVNHQAGAKTQLASLVTAAIVLVTLLMLTPLFHYLPKAVLGAVVVAAVVGLVNVSEAVRLFRVKAVDGWTLVVTFLATLTVGVEVGVLAGVGLSLLLFIWRSSRPHMAELGYLQKEGVFRNVKRYPEAVTTPEVLILRVDASLYFANMGFVEDHLRERLAPDHQVRWVVLDMSGVNDIDAVAIHALEEVMSDFAHRGIQFAFSGMKGPVRDLVAKAGWEEKLGKRIQYMSVEQAFHDIGTWPGQPNPTPPGVA